MDEVGAVLVRLKLGRYADAMARHGHDDWAEIVGMPRAKLENLVRRVGMVDNHADRFRGFVAEQAAAANGALQGAPDAEAAPVPSSPAAPSVARVKRSSAGEQGGGRPKRSRR